MESGADKTAHETVPFLRLESASELEKAMMAYALEEMRGPTDHLIPEENSHTLLHGSRWIHEREGEEPAAGGFERLESAGRLTTADIVNADMAAIDRFANQLAEQMLEAMSKRMYTAAGEAAEAVGNSISMQNAGSVPAAFLEMLRRVEFGVSRTGEVTRPAIHMHPDTASQVIPILESQGEDFEGEVARITAEKEAAAIAREDERKAKFRARSDDGAALGPRDRL